MRVRDLTINMEQCLTAEAEGKSVFNPDGTEIGLIRKVDNGLAYVKPDPSLPEALVAKLGMAEADRHTYPLDNNKIEKITTDGVQLHEDSDFGTD